MRISAFLFILSYSLSQGENCMRDESHVDISVCRKSCQTDDDCRGDLKRCYCDGFCGMSCFNPNATCDLPEPIENGQINVISDQIYGSFISYTCNEGYGLEGSFTRQCQSNRQWSGDAPTCIVICSSPPGVPGAFTLSARNEYRPGETVDYLCRSGFLLNGTTTRTCQVDGNWSPATFNCILRRCPQPVIPQNGYIEGNTYTFGSRVFYYCNDGYVINQDQNFISCVSSGDWSGDIPECNPITCPNPESPENGVASLLGGLVFGSRVSYSCNNGFQLVGPSIGQCHSNQTWGEVPICKVIRGCDFNNFRNSFCSLRVEGSTQYAWERTLSVNGRNGSAGFVAKTTSNRRPSSRSEAKLISLPINVNDFRCVEFYYNIESLEADTDFFLAVVEENTGVRMTGWSANTRERKNQWHSAVVRFEDQPSMIRIEFVAQSSPNPINIVQIDDIDFVSSCRNPCSSNPCRNQGYCVNRIGGSFDCICPREYTGQFCGTVAPCSLPNPPTNGLILQETPYIDYEDRISIQCNSGFFSNAPGISRAEFTCEFNNTWSSPLPTSCVDQVLCTTNDEPCVFPFIYDGTERTECIRYTFWFTSWCATTDNYDRDDLRGTCTECPIKWENWGNWGDCSSSCGTGQQTRTRNCRSADVGSLFCPGLDQDVRSCVTPCSDVEIELNGRLYHFVETQRNFEDARLFCQNDQGDLAIIRSEIEQNTIESAAKTLSFSASQLYFGLRRTENGFEWVDNLALRDADNNWDTGEPNNYDNSEDCAVLLQQKSKWNDIPCHLERPFICERAMRPCDSSPCLNGGTCRIRGQAYICLCPENYGGDECQTPEP